MSRTVNIYVNAVALALLGLLSGCAGSPTPGYIRSIEYNNPINPRTLYADNLKHGSLSEELYLMERGRMAQMLGDYETSRQSFCDEIDILKKRELDDNTLPGAEINTGSVLVNDNMLPYKARLFEVEMLYLYQSFNYLGKGDLDGALVEIRNADFLLNEAEEAREMQDYKEEEFRKSEAGVQKKLFENEQNMQKKAEKVKEKAKSPPPPPPVEQKPSKPVKNSEDIFAEEDSAAEPSSETSEAESEAQKKKEVEAAKTEMNSKRNTYEARGMAEYEKSFANMADTLAKSKASFLNPYVIYVCGILHEMNGDIDDAYICYKKALGLMPDNPYLQRDLVRTAIKLGRTEDYESLKSTYPEIWEQFKKEKTGENGRLVVLYEYGWAPRKKEVFITLAAVAVAYPVYDFRWRDVPPLRVSSDLGEVGNTAPICYMNSLAVHALKEEAKWRVIRQTARVIVKGSAFAAGAVMTASSDNDAVKATGIGIMIASALYNNLSENADLRCFMSLPENVQILVAEMPPGEHKMKFGQSLEERIPISTGKTTIVRVIQAGPRTIFQLLWPNKPAEKEENANQPREGN